MPVDTFEIIAKDGAARLGKLYTAHKTVTTPAFVPVINPHLPVVSVDDLKKLGFELFITNAYLLYKDEKLREKVLSQGIHKTFNWDGAIMTDSGAFQLMVYGDVEVSNLEIIEFQHKIGVDIGVILDIPVYKGSIEYRKKFINETIRRAKEAQDAGFVVPDSKTIWVGPIHGVPYYSLLKYSVDEMTKIPFGMYAVGSIVPLMESYQLIQLVKAAVYVKSILPSNYPVHLFGVGHPATFALFALLGYDTFDSAAYALYAKDGRYFTPEGTYRLGELKYFPCNCPVCSTYTPQELMKMDPLERQHLLALHNLYQTVAEIKRIRQAIEEGTLWQLVARRASAHPEIARAYRWLLKNREGWVFEYFEEMEPTFKRRGVMITRIEELNLPIVQRYKRRLKERIYLWSDKAIITTPEGFNHLKIRLGAQLFILNPVFGIIPAELRHVYPLFQHMSFISEIGENSLNFAKEIIELLRSRGIKEIFVFDRDKNYALQLKEVLGADEVYEGQDVGIISREEYELNVVKAMLKYQFGPGAEDVISRVYVEYSQATNLMRKIYARDVTEEEIEKIITLEIEKLIKKRKKAGKTVPERPLEELFFDRGRIWLLGAIAPTYFKIVPHPLLAYRIWKKFKDSELRYMVVLKDEAEEFVRAGRSIFSKFIIDLDNNIRAEDEIFVLNEEKELIAIAKAIISAREMREFKRGVAASNRWGFPK